MRALEGQLHWRAGENAEAIAALQDAIRGFRERPNPAAEWASRSMLVDLLFATHAVDEVDAAVEGWDQPVAAAGASALAPAVAMYGATAFASFARFEESERLAQAAKRHPEQALLPPFEALQRLFIDLPAGGVDQVCEQLDAATRAMEHFDPLQRRQHILGVLAIIYADRGDAEEALRQMARRARRGARARRPAPHRRAHAWCALLHARAGRLQEAEAELAQLRNVESSARSYVNELAPAGVASLRGDAGATLAAAERTLATVETGPILFRYWADPPRRAGAHRGARRRCGVAEIPARRRVPARGRCEVAPESRYTRGLPSRTVRVRIGKSARIAATSRTAAPLRRKSQSGPPPP